MCFKVVGLAIMSAVLSDVRIELTCLAPAASLSASSPAPAFNWVIPLTSCGVLAFNWAVPAANFATPATKVGTWRLSICKLEAKVLAPLVSCPELAASWLAPAAAWSTPAVYWSIPATNLLMSFGLMLFSLSNIPDACSCFIVALKPFNWFNKSFESFIILLALLKV